MTFHIIVSASDGDQKVDPTALEVSAALTFAHRLFNTAVEAAGGGQEQDQGPWRAQPFVEKAHVNLYVREVRNGSVEVLGVLDAVALGVLGNLSTMALVAVAKRLRKTFQRLQRASRGRWLRVEVRHHGHRLRIECEFDGHSVRVVVTALD